MIIGGPPLMAFDHADSRSAASKTLQEADTGENGAPEAREAKPLIGPVKTIARRGKPHQHSRYSEHPLNLADDGDRAAGAHPERRTAKDAGVGGGGRSHRWVRPIDHRRV